MDVATLGIEVDTSSTVQARTNLRALAAEATATEKATKSWGAAAVLTGGSTAQMATQSSVASKNLGALKAALETVDRSGQSMGNTVLTGASSLKMLSETATGSKLAMLGLFAVMGPLLAIVIATSVAFKAFHAGMKAADIGEEADQIGITTDALQALRAEASQVGVEAGQMDAAMRRFTATMGNANKGGDEQIKMFNSLGVKILDANGKMRSLEDTLPEVAQGLLKMQEGTERNARMLELFGRSGTKMVTMLGSLAGGMDNMVESAKKQGLVLDRDVIEVWDKLKDSMVKVGLQSDVTFAKLGAPIVTDFLVGVENILRRIAGLMDQISSKQGFWSSILEESKAGGSMGGLKLEPPDVKTARLLREKQAELSSPAAQGRESMIQEEIDKLEREKEARNQSLRQLDQTRRANEFAPGASPLLKGGASNPIPKGASDEAEKLAKAYEKIKDGATDAIAKYKMEQETLGQSAEAIARAKNELELLNKATDAGIKLTPNMTEELKKLAAGMAEAEVKAQGAKNVFKELEGAKEFIAQQQLAQQAMGMSAEAAARLKYETELLNKASENGAIILGTDQVAALKAAAGEMAAMEAQTKSMADGLSFVKDIFSDLFSDLKDALLQGKNLWEAFGNAALGVLSKVADKMLNMVLDGTMSAFFGGGNSTSGSKSGGIGGMLGGFSGIGDSLSGMMAQTKNFFGFGNGASSSVGAPGMFPEFAPGAGAGIGSGFGLGNVLGAAGGVAGGIMGLSKGGTAGTIGGITSLIGAGVSLIPGIGQVAGPIIGLLGSILPSLFGGGAQAPPVNQASGSLSYGAGGFSTSGGAWGPDANAASLTGPLAGIGKSMDAIFKAFGGVKDAGKVWGVAMQSFSQGDFSNQTSFLTGPGGSQRQWGKGSNEGDIGMEQAGVQATLESILGGALGDITENMRKALETVNMSGKDTFATLSEVVGEVMSFDETVKGFGHTSSEAEQALKAIDDQMASLYDTAAKFGLSTNPLDLEKTRLKSKVGQDFTDSIAKQLMDPMTAAFLDLGDERTAMARNNAALLGTEGYLDQSNNIWELYWKKRNAIQEQYDQAAIAALRDTLDAQKTMLGSLSEYIKTLLPGGALAGEGLNEQLAGLKGTYAAAQARASASPLDADAVSAFMKAGQEMLDFEKSFFGGDTRYQDERLRSLSDAQAIQAAIAGQVQSGVNNLGAKGATDPGAQELLKTVADLNQKIADLISSQASLNARLSRQSGNSGR